MMRISEGGVGLGGEGGLCGILMLHVVWFTVLTVIYRGRQLGMT